MDMVGLENATKIGLVRCARAKALDGRRLVSERLKERKREFLGIEGAFR